MLSDFRAFRLAKEFHLVCKKLKVQRLLYDQLFRASASIALNLAEGSAKRTSLEQRRFYGIALASLRECEAALELAEIYDPALRKQLDDLGAIVFTLCKPPQKVASKGH